MFHSTVYILLPMYHNQTLHNLQSGLSLTGAPTHTVGVGHNYITIIYDCTAYVCYLDSAELFANGPSLAGASTYALGTGNKNIILNFS